MNLSRFAAMIIILVAFNILAALFAWVFSESFDHACLMLLIGGYAAFVTSGIGEKETK